MTKQTSTKRALLLSTLSLLMCVSMLIGSTFAWFTDSVISGRNKIVAGNLDVVLEYKTDWDSDWTPVDENTKIFKAGALYEPGYTEVVYFRVSNAGSLALKYNLKINVLDEKGSTNVNGDAFNLSDYLQIGTYVQDEYASGFNYADILIPVMFGNRESAVSNVPMAKLSEADSLVVSGAPILAGDQTAQVGAIVLTMPEAVGNEANYDSKVAQAPTVDLGIRLVATQHTHESDSFNNQYDKEAIYGQIVDRGTYGGVDWTLDEFGTFTVAPTITPEPDAGSGSTFEIGAWREAVIYNEEGEAVAIGGYPYDVNAVTSLVIKEGVTSIGSFTAKFPNLTGEVIIPSTVTYIGQEAFQNCPITKLTFAEGGTQALCIAPGAFKKLAVEEIVLPADRPEIHIHCWAFNDCVSLKRVTFPANVTTFSKWTHVDYCGMDYVNGGDSQTLARCRALETLTFGSQAVHDLFFNAPYNTSNINAVGNVEIIVQN